MTAALITHTTNYRIIRKIADGGMASVYEALQDGVEGFHKTVALKRMHDAFLEKERFVSMFIAEAKLVANLVHENIVQIYQFGKDQEGYFIVMEYVHGMFLHEFVRLHRLQKKKIPYDLCVFIASRIARGLAYAHERKDNMETPLNIVHRDVSPKNIAITTEGLPKLADFGLAVPIPTTPGKKSKMLVGKLSYMAPEQAEMTNVDFRSDIFSLGIVLFELLSLTAGRSYSNNDELLKLAQAGITNAQQLPSDVPQDVKEVLFRCVAKNPADRFQSTASLGRELELCIYRHGYGPTIQTLEQYLRDLCPELYKPR